MENSQSSHRFRLLGVGLVMGCLLAYGAVVTFDFVNYDDPKYVVNNPHLRHGLTVEGLTWAFTTNRSSNWHPLTWISHMIDYQLYGLAAGGHHLTSLLFHIANTLLLFGILFQMTRAMWRSAIVAALFAWHPLHAESVVWISERKDVLSAFFWLLAMSFYLRYAADPGTRTARPKAAYGLALVCFVLGLLSKPMVVTLPFVLLLLNYWPLRRVSGFRVWSSDFRRPLLETVPFLLLSAASSVVTFLAQRSGGAVISLQRVPISHRVANALISYAIYLRKTIWPDDLAVIYPLRNSFSAGKLAGATLLLLLISIAAMAWNRSRPWFLVGWLWFLGTLVPVIGFVQVGRQSMADRYTYLPLVGIFVMLVWGVAELAERRPQVKRFLLPAATAATLMLCLALTWVQASTWRNSITLFNHALAVTPRNAVALDNLGVALNASGRSDEAMTNYNAALQLEPGEPYILYHKALVLAQQNQTEAAMQLFIAAIRNKPDLAAAHYHLARLLAAQGRLDDAVAEYLACLRFEPDTPDGHYNLANVLMSQGKLAEAAAHYRASLRLDPDSSDAHNNLGAVLVRLGSLDEAVAQFQAVLKLNPNSAEAEDQLGGALQKLGQFEAARAHYAAAVRLNPELVHARLKLGLLLAQQGQFEAAQLQLQQVISREPTNDVAWYNVAGIHAAQGRWKEAASAFDKVIELKPEDAEAHARLGGVLAQAGKWDGAITAYEQAAALTGRRNPGVLAALDQAYARAGRLPEAIQTAQAVEELAGALKQPAVAEAAARRLKFYRAGKPYQE